MGDRTYTTVTIHKASYKQLLGRYGGDKEVLCKELDIDEVEDEMEDTLVFLSCEEANYGEMETLEKLLRASKIEYDKEWERGDEYEAGELFCRNINGKMESFERYVTNKALCETLIVLRDMKPEEREAFIHKTIKEVMPFEPTPLKAPNSVHFITED